MVVERGAEEDVCGQDGEMLIQDFPRSGKPVKCYDWRVSLKVFALKSLISGCIYSA